jgi:hypothetical protein
MSFERSFMNWEEGLGICCWDAPSRDELEALFRKAGVPFEKMLTVEEHEAQSLVK